MSTPQTTPSQPCPICGEVHANGELHPVSRSLMGQLTPEQQVNPVACVGCLERLRINYVTSALEDDRREIGALDQEIVRSLREQEIVTQNIEAQFETKASFGERIADRVASFGGSWAFIGIFAAILLVWIVVNSVLGKPFDPYPFILMNLILSCLAAIQAPIIMMSQNRQESRDRARGENDYKVNLKAELEIRHLHEKLDHLINHQWQRLLEIQRLQTELMEELASQRSGRPRSEATAHD